MIIIIIIWLVLVFVLMKAGEKRKIGGSTILLISLFLSPLVGFIVLMISDELPKITTYVNGTLTDTYYNSIIGNHYYIEWYDEHSQWCLRQKGTDLAVWYKDKNEAIQEMFKREYPTVITIRGDQPTEVAYSSIVGTHYYIEWYDEHKQWCLRQKETDLAVWYKDKDEALKVLLGKYQLS